MKQKEPKEGWHFRFCTLCGKKIATFEGTDEELESLWNRKRFLRAQLNLHNFKN